MRHAAGTGVPQPCLWIMVFSQNLGEAPMSVECSMLAIGAERNEALRRNPKAIKDEVILRQALDHLAVMSSFKTCMTEREVLAEIRVSQRNLNIVDDPVLRQQMAERYEREDALVDAALARDDREGPLRIGSNWKQLTEILAGGENSRAAAYFLGAPRFGEDVGYGPAGLHDPSDVAAFASHLNLWTPERFGAAAASRRSESLPVADAGHLSPEFFEVRLFQTFRIYILDTATARAGMLIWMS
jgi:Domain of unknown function (DUF1877)